MLFEQLLQIDNLKVKLEAAFEGRVPVTLIVYVPVYIVGSGIDKITVLLGEY